MSFAQSPQAKGYSLLLLLLTHIILELPSPASSGRCEERCDNNRLPGSTAEYILYCDRAYHSNSDINYCKKDCDHCPSTICNLHYNRNVYYCPAIRRDSQRCKKHCDDHRPTWQSSRYTLNCKQEYNTLNEIKFCNEICMHCPREICVMSTPDVFKCPSKDGPSPPISGFCESRCNNNRPKGTSKAYTLSCLKDYSTIDEINYCREHCPFCPRDVCNPYDPDIFNCPAGNSAPPPVISGRCKKRCDDNREQGTTGAYILDCREEYDLASHLIQYCREDCKDCEKEFCDPAKDSNIFYCPKIPRPLPPPPYEGDCEDRCDLNRAKGTYGLSNDPLTFNCDKVSSWQTDDCKRDCKKCPKDVCNSKKNPKIYNCPPLKIRKRCDNMCAANRKYGSTNAYTLQCSTAYSSDLEIDYCRSYCQDCPLDVCDPSFDNDTYSCPVDRDQDDSNHGSDPSNSNKERSDSTLFNILVILVLLVVVVSIVVGIYCFVRKKKPRAQVGQYYGAPAGGVYPSAGGQFVQQQPYQMYYNNAPPPMPMSASSLSSPRSVPSSPYGSTTATYA